MNLFLFIIAICSCRLNIDKTPTHDDRNDPTESSETGDSAAPLPDSGIPETGEPDPPDPQDGLSRVVVLVMDGARIDETFGEGVSSVTGSPTATFLPEIRRELFPHGSLLSGAMNTGVTITAEGHAALLTGRHTALPNMRNDLGAGKMRPDFPTLFEVLRAGRGLPQESVLLMGNTVHLEGHLDSANPAWGEGAMYGFVENPEIPGQPAGNDIDVIDALKVHLGTHDTHLAVVNLHNVDRTAHYNTNRAAYADRIQVLDEPIVEFWNWLQSREGYANNTILVIVADHGRHRWGTENDHRHHGDQCAGCRQVPMFLLGPGVRPGHTLEDPVDLTDLGVTLAYLLGEKLPYAHGNVIHEILLDPPTSPSEVDQVERSYVGLEQVTQNGTGQGATVWRNDEQVSDPSANRAEAPMTATFGERAAYCWRELHLTTESVGNWPWRLQCHHQTTPEAPWQPLDGPLDIVWPFSRPSMSMDTDGRIWLAIVDNVTGNWEAATQAIRLTRWSSETGWRGVEFGEDAVLYPTHPTMVHTEGGSWIGYITSDPLTDLTDDDTASPAEGTPVDLKARARHRRHVAISQVLWDEESEPVWSTIWRSYNADHFVDGVILPAPPGVWEGWENIDRVDRPGLAKIGSTFALAFLAYPTDGGIQLGLVLSGESVEDWETPTFIDVTGGVLPHMTPQWASNRLGWGRTVGDEHLVCSVRIEGSSPSTPICVPIEGTEIDHLRLTDSGYLLSVKADDTWATVEGAW